MKKVLVPAFIVVALFALVTTGTFAGGSKEQSSTTSTTTQPAASSAASNFLAGVVTDTGGIDDRSFNASAWKGLEDAKAKDGIQIQYLQSTNQSDYVPNIQQFVQKKAGLIVTVGFLMGDATKAAAAANPDQKFAIVDYSYDPPLSNVLALTYQTDQAAFLGGYLAAAMSKSGKVGTFGGMKIPTVTIYMDGFVAGVRYYDQQKGKKVTTLGWDPEKAEGTFTNDFTSQAKGKTVTEAMMNQGADIIFPVAGSVGLGSAAAVQQHNTASPNSPVYMEWVDTDGCVSASQYCGLFITSVEKGIAVSVQTAAEEALKGTFKGGNYVGTLANGGTQISPFHDFESKVPASVKAELATIKKGIIDGSISVDPKSYPAP
ncbi:MAG TPA: BMP family ABC transporter substrate-binding protein [Spirochaetia bacterium]|nr:BMP family ABC transporter substrate-binding protein [Spirochaetia bacterium]